MSAIDNQKIYLSRKDDQLYLRFDGDHESVPVSALLAAPLSEDRKIISIVHKKDRKELVLLKTLDRLDESGRKLLRDEIQRRYFLPQIEKINDVNIHLGDYYWDVITDRGSRKFLLRSPAINMRWVGSKRIILCDSDGIHYDLDDFDSLDKDSRKLLERIL